MPVSINRSYVLGCAVGVGLACLIALSSLPQPKVIEVPTTAAEFNTTIQALGLGSAASIGFALGLDYLFIACYVTAIGLGCAAGRRAQRDGCGSRRQQGEAGAADALVAPEGSAATRSNEAQL